MRSETLQWSELSITSSVEIPCQVDIRIHPAESDAIILLVPGVDGSVDGYDNKYRRIAERLNKKGYAVVRMSHPFVSSQHWHAPLTRVLSYIRENAQTICGKDEYELWAQGHSAGAAVLAMEAQDWPEITKLLLINTATALQPHNILEGLMNYDRDVLFLQGSDDPAAEEVEELAHSLSRAFIMVNGADHHFSGEQFETFLSAAEKHLLSSHI